MAEATHSSSTDSQSSKPTSLVSLPSRPGTGMLVMRNRTESPFEEIPVLSVDFSSDQCLESDFVLSVDGGSRTGGSADISGGLEILARRSRLPVLVEWENGNMRSRGDCWRVRYGMLV